MSLQKLKIRSYNTPACTGTPLNEIEALINPEGYSQDYKVTYDDPKIIGDSAKSLFFSGMGTNVITINKLIVDGTGVAKIGNAANPDDYISKFKDTVYTYVGTMHSPPYIMLTWGAKNLTFKGVCTSLKVDYKLFKPDGSTLRAFIDITVTGNIDFASKEMEAQKSSPDLTHIRTVKAGDTLPLMAYHIYNSSTNYLTLAKQNNLNSVYQTTPGQKLYFPPLPKK